ncbi:hypothetical protein LINGRAHAP2_LOCUS15996 [Linum grandiflorum]
MPSISMTNSDHYSELSCLSFSPVFVPSPQNQTLHFSGGCMAPPPPHKGVADPRSSSIDSCAFHLQSWRPFNLSPPKDSPDPSSSKLYTYTLAKRPCLSDRATSFPIDSIDISRLSLIDDDKSIPHPPSSSAAVSPYRRGPLGILARKRPRRRGASRSVSGRSSDRSANRRCCSVGASAAHGTCSDFPVAIGTDSSGELFVNGGDPNWASDVSEARNSSKEEKECLVPHPHGGGQFGNLEAQVADSGYGSEPGYRGDAEFGYGDEFDEEEEDPRPLFWGHHLRGTMRIQTLRWRWLGRTHYSLTRRPITDAVERSTIAAWSSLLDETATIFWCQAPPL